MRPPTHLRRGAAFVLAAAALCAGAGPAHAVVGGEPVEPAGVPWFVSLGGCGGTLVAPDRVLAVDFKSHQAVPRAPDAVPEAILRQMGAYRAALAPIFPGRRIETAVLWTRAACLMPLPAALTAAALARAAGEL